MVERLPLSKTLPVLCRQLAGVLSSTQSLEGPWTSEKECFLAIVNQAIECRAAGDPATSLLMLEWLHNQGIEHAYLLFHRIASLIDLDRYTGLCLPALAALEQANMLKAASDALQIHIDTLLRNMQAIAMPSGATCCIGLLSTVPSKLHERLFSFVHSDSSWWCSFSKAILEELMVGSVGCG